MHPDHLGHPDRGVPAERRRGGLRLAQRLLVGERQFPQVGQGHQGSRVDAVRGEQVRVERRAGRQSGELREEHRGDGVSVLGRDEAGCGHVVSFR
ncbi:hypothetical protein [Nonomuraea salmonea]|uniref:hypothetical protein n=1 Tax=Nonomuraea salmonea TaxID=46181 RepID=UPI002FEA2B70